MPPPPPPPPPPLPMEDDDLHRTPPASQQPPPQQPSSVVASSAAAAAAASAPPPPPHSQQHHHSLSLALPIHLNHSRPPLQLQQPPHHPPPSLASKPSQQQQQHHHHHQPNGADRPSRDDCWSEGATNTLIDAWGDRYIELNRGNLKQKHWKDVADAVNGRDGGSKVPKTDVQCKNRLDTLKKKYKMEKSKIVIGGGPSKWPFYDRLDDLIGPSKKQKKPPLLKPRLNDKRPAEEPDQQPIFNIVTYNNNNATDTNSKSKESPDMTDSCPHGLANTADAKNSSKRKRPYESPFKDLERAILKFGEVYERIEIAKQQQMMDLEKQRMEFAKDLEVQRMQLFMQTQLELAKMKHSKHGNTEHYL